MCTNKFAQIDNIFLRKLFQRHLLSSSCVFFLLYSKYSPLEVVSENIFFFFIRYHFMELRFDNLRFPTNRQRMEAPTRAEQIPRPAGSSIPKGSTPEGEQDEGEETECDMPELEPASTPSSTPLRGKVDWDQWCEDACCLSPIHEGSWATASPASPSS